MNPIPPVSRLIRARIETAARAARAGLRRTHLEAFSHVGTGRAEIGMPFSQFSRSQARCSAVAYRFAGSFSRHFRQIVSRSSGSQGGPCGARGLAFGDELDQAVRSVAWNAGRRVSSS